MKQDIILTVLVVLVVVLSIMRLKNVSTMPGNSLVSSLGGELIYDPEWTYRYPFVVSCGRQFRSPVLVSADPTGLLASTNGIVNLASLASRTFQGWISSSTLTLTATNTTDPPVLHVPFVLTTLQGTATGTLDNGISLVSKASGSAGTLGATYTLNFANSSGGIGLGGSSNAVFTQYDHRYANVIMGYSSSITDVTNGVPTLNAISNLWTFPGNTFSTNPGRNLFVTDQSLTGSAGWMQWGGAKSYEDLNRAMWLQPMSETAGGSASNNYSNTYTTLYSGIKLPGSNVIGFFKVLVTSGAARGTTTARSNTVGTGALQFIYSDKPPAYNDNFLSDVSSLSLQSIMSNTATVIDTVTITPATGNAVVFSVPSGIITCRSFKSPREDNTPCVFTNQYVDSSNLQARVNTITGWVNGTLYSSSNTISNNMAVATCPSPLTACSANTQAVQVVSYNTTTRNPSVVNSDYQCVAPKPILVPCACSGATSTAVNFGDLRSGAIQ